MTLEDGGELASPTIQAGRKNVQGPENSHKVTFSGHCVGLKPFSFKGVITRNSLVHVESIELPEAKMEVGAPSSGWDPPKMWDTLSPTLYRITSVR